MAELQLLRGKWDFLDQFLGGSVIQAECNPSDDMISVEPAALSAPEHVLINAHLGIGLPHSRAVADQKIAGCLRTAELLCPIRRNRLNLGKLQELLTVLQVVLAQLHPRLDILQCTR